MVEDAIAHYSECGNIDYIHIVWCEKQAPPEKILQRFAKTTPVVMFDLRNDSLNSRFLPLPEGNNELHTVSLKIPSYAKFVFQRVIFKWRLLC